MSNGLKKKNESNRQNQRGVVLLITLVILVILATLGYTLSARVAARRHRDQYIIDYGQAKYACVSALKYALTSVKDLEPELISRPNEPDFSDVFALSELEYQELLAQFAESLAATDANRVGALAQQDVESIEGANDVNATGAAADQVSGSEAPAIPGPYGPSWPLATAPSEFEIGSARVKIEIEDENAKYPLGWALIADDKLKPAADVGFVTFCEWMGYAAKDLDLLRADLGKINEIRPFKLDFKPLAGPVQTPVSLRSRISRARSSKTPVRRATASKTVSVTDQIDQQNADFVKLFHSSLINADLLARPSIVSGTRKESAMRYLGLWATRKVNVNTAPRHVLEAALTFGSIADAPKIAEEIIQQRRVKPFSDTDELKKVLFRYSDSIDKCQEFITTASTVFTVKVTAVSGVAKATAVAAVSKEGDTIKQIAVVSD
jgi:Tfp pilus assembly protein PilX